MKVLRLGPIRNPVEIEAVFSLPRGAILSVTRDTAGEIKAIQYDETKVPLTFEAQVLARLIHRRRLQDSDPDPDA